VIDVKSDAQKSTVMKNWYRPNGFVQNT